MLNDDLATGRLVQVLPASEAPARPIYLLFAQDRQSTPKLRSFIDFVVAAFS